MRRLLPLVLGLFVVLASSAPLQVAARGTFTPAACLAEAPSDRTVDCGTVALPLHADAPDGPQITLPIMIVRSTTSNDHRPLFLLQGGPGGDSIETFVSLIGRPDSTIPTDRDIVFFEQRGTTHATPTLNCPEISESVAALYAPGMTDEQQLARSMADWQACADRLRAAGTDLAAFHSLANADDVAAIAEMLGHDSIDLYGVSYGTLLAQHVVARHPNLVHALVLDGVVPTTVNPQTQWLQSRQTAFANLFADCVATVDCARAYPDLSTRLPALISRIDAAPLTLRLRNISADTTHDIEFAGDDVAGVLFQMMYDSEMATFVPMLIDQLEHEQYDAFRNIAGLLLFYDGMSEGMQATTTCAEEAPAIPADYTVPAPTLFPIGPDVVTDDIAWTTQWCDIAAVPALDPVVNQPIKSPVPVLISSGRYDPITPAELAAVVAPWFDRAQVIVTPSGAHGAILDNACAGQIFVAFLDDPTQTLDTSCLTTQETRFATPSTISRTSAAAKALNGENPIGAWLAPGLLGFFWLLSILLLRPVSTVVRLAQGKPAPAAAVRIYHVVQFLTAAAALVYVVVLIAVLYDSAIVQNSLAFFFGIPKIPIYLTSLWGFPLLSVFYVALWVRLLAQRQQSLTGMVYTVTTVAALIGVFGALIALGVYPG